MFLPRDEPREGQQLRKSLHHLGDSIQSLLGSKENLTFRWAESVRLIIEDLSIVCASPDSPTSPLRSEQIGESEREKLEEDVSKLEGELVKLRALLREEDERRSDLLSKYLDLKGNVRVFCRVRPLLSKEQRATVGSVIIPGLDKILVQAPTRRKAFQLDKIFLPASSQDEVFAEVGPLVRSALDGHNVCIFAYGQTGTGKTFTMEGTKECPGVVPRTLQLLFHLASFDSRTNFVFTFSMLELYMGCLRDLLVPPSRRITDPPPKCLSIQMDVKGRVEVENLTEYVVRDVNQASQLYRIGSRARSTACTNSNETSSRSHSLVRVTMSSAGGLAGCPVVSKLWLIDLGGSERLLKTEAKGQSLEEGKAINLSLSALGDVINALQKKQQHIPYRNSKLTQILRDSLGEDAKSVILVHVSPKEDDIGETICSLGFATRARGIHLGTELSAPARIERARAMEDTAQRLQEHESSCLSIRDNIQELEFLCRKKKEMLENGKQEGENPRDELMMIQHAISENSHEKKGRTIDWLENRPRFMTATTCSSLKKRIIEANSVIPWCGARKDTKLIQAQRRCSSGSKNRAAKISPVDCSPGSEHVTEPKQSGVLSKDGDARGSELIHHLAGTKLMNPSPHSGRKLMNVMVNELSRPGQCHLPKQQEYKHHRVSERRASHELPPRTNPSSVVTRRRLTLECSSQITINTRF